MSPLPEDDKSTSLSIPLSECMQCVTNPKYSSVPASTARFRTLVLTMKSRASCLATGNEMNDEEPCEVGEEEEEEVGEEESDVFEILFSPKDPAFSSFIVIN